MKIVVALVAVTVLAACSGGSKPAPTVTVTKTPNGSASVAPSTRAGLTNAAIDRAYLSVMRPVLPGVKDATLKELAHDVCASFDAGSTWIQQVATIVHSGLNGHQAGELIGASTGAYCPQYSHLAPLS